MILEHAAGAIDCILKGEGEGEGERGCPWDCTFCSAWTFYGRSYRLVSPEVAVEDLMRIREPCVSIVDDVAFIQSKHGTAIASKGIKKNYHLETRADILLRNREGAVAPSMTRPNVSSTTREWESKLKRRWTFSA